MRWLWALVLVGVCACPNATSRGPLYSLRRYLDLASDGQVDAAYAMLSEDFHRRCDRNCYARILLAQRQELLRARDQVRNREARLDLHGDVFLPDGTTLRLVQSSPPDGEPSSKSPLAENLYLFSENPLDFYPQDTPERTLASFLRAVEARRYDILLRFMPQSLSEQYSAEVLRDRFDGTARAGVLAQLAAVQKHLAEPLILDKERMAARLPVGDGKEARLVLEEGRWRVVQLQ